MATIFEDNIAAQEDLVQKAVVAVKAGEGKNPDEQIPKAVAELDAQSYSADTANLTIGLLAAKEQLQKTHDGKSKEESLKRARKEYFEHHDKRNADQVTGDIMHQLGVDKMSDDIQKQVKQKLLEIAKKKDGLTELKEIDLNLQNARRDVKGEHVDAEAQKMRDHLDAAATGQYIQDFKDALKPVLAQHVNPSDKPTLSVVKAVGSFAKDSDHQTTANRQKPNPGGGQADPAAQGDGAEAHFASGKGDLAAEDKATLDKQIDAAIAKGGNVDVTITVGHDATGSRAANLRAMKARQAAVEAEIQARVAEVEKRGVQVKINEKVVQVDPTAKAKGEDAKMRFAKLQFGAGGH